jgi:hypothetical protein
MFCGVGKEMQSKPKLPKVVRALRTPRRFPDRLHRWQQEPNEYTNDRDHDQQFHQAKPETALRPRKTHHFCHSKIKF